MQITTAMSMTNRLVTVNEQLKAANASDPVDREKIEKAGASVRRALRVIRYTPINKLMERDERMFKSALSEAKLALPAKKELVCH